MTVIEVKVPNLGDFKDVEIIEVHVAVGDTVKAEGTLITIETDKAVMEVPSSAAGVVKELLVHQGDRVSERQLILRLEGEGRASQRAGQHPADSSFRSLRQQHEPGARRANTPRRGDTG